MIVKGVQESIIAADGHEQLGIDANAGAGVNRYHQMFKNLKQT